MHTSARLPGWRASVCKRKVTGVLLALALWPSSTAAQEQLAVRADVLFYGDNTEFRNPFREGETIFGAAARASAEIALNGRVTLSAGGFANQRFGSERGFEQVRPVLALEVRGSRSSFVFGTLPPLTSARMPVGADRGGPHGLLPPLQRETLSFDRAYETGLAWTFAGAEVQHHFWLEWQRLNTAEHRERFDGGVNFSYRLLESLSVPLQLHVVHEGGQLYDAGAVADSAAVAAGAVFSRRIGPAWSATLEMYALGSRFVPDRSRDELSRDGVGFFGRASAEHNGWRTHVTFWRGRNFIKDEGDPNYLSIARSGDRYTGTRDYAEAGLTRRFTLAPAAVLDVSARLHRVEGRYEYSYRIVSVLSALWTGR